LGRSGSGKSGYILNQIKNEINLDERIYIITPEQFSYVTEKKLLKVLGETATINCEVISFDRIAHRVLAEVGGAAKVKLSKSGKAMLVYNILEKQKKNLKFLGNSNDNIDLMLKTISELKKHNITVDKLIQTEDEIEDMYLKTKIQDINNIYSLYENGILNKYIDEDDSLTILAKSMDESSMFDGAIVYIDEFAGFTEQEYNIIKKLFKKAKKVSIAICTDTSTFNELTKPELDVFYYNKKAAKKLIEMVGAHDCARVQSWTPTN